MDASCLEHVLTEQERNMFNEQGYLILENSLSAEQVDALEKVTDRIHAEKVASGFNPTEIYRHLDFIAEDDLFLNLIDYEKIFPKVWGILGWNIYLYHAHLMISPPTGKPESTKTLGWHQDSGRVNKEIESHPRPRLSIKIAYFLSDCSEAGRGNFWIVPGSHLKDQIELPPDREGQPEGAIPVKVKPGTAVIFDRRLWHSASPNWSDISRKVLFCGYSYRWLRTKSEMSVESLLERSTPIRRQLLGDGLNCNGYFSPKEDDVPLKSWLEEHQLVKG